MHTEVSPAANRPCKPGRLTRQLGMMAALLLAAGAQTSAVLAQPGSSPVPAVSLTIEITGVPDPLLPLLETTEAQLERDNGLVLLLNSAGHEAGDGLQQSPLRVELLTPTRFVLERIRAQTDATPARVILGKLDFPGDQAGALESDGEPQTLTALARGNLPQTFTGPESLLLTTVRQAVDDHLVAYSQLLASLNTAIFRENTTRGDAANSTLLLSRPYDPESAPAPFYNLSLDWSLITSLQLRLAWARQVYPAFATARHDILTWIEPYPLAVVAPQSVDRIFLSAGDNTP